MVLRENTIIYYLKQYHIDNALIGNVYGAFFSRIFTSDKAHKKMGF